MSNFAMKINGMKVWRRICDECSSREIRNQQNCFKLTCDRLRCLHGNFTKIVCRS